MPYQTKKIYRIGIDARFYGPVGKGLGRYTQEIVDRVIKMDIDNEYVIFLGKENYDNFSFGFAQDRRVKKVLVNVRWYTLAEQILMPYYIWREKLDLIHFPHFNVPIFCPTKFMVTIHDLILTKFPTTRATTLGPALYKIKNFCYKVVIWLAVKRAQKVIAVSRFTSHDIIKTFKIKPEKVAVTYEGVANIFRADDKDENSSNKILEKYKIFSPFLLYVGNAYPHKNLEGLIRVFGEIIKNTPLIRGVRGVNETGGINNPLNPPYQGDNFKNLHLVLVGKEDYFYKRTCEYAEKLFGPDNKEIIFPGYVPDDDLNYFYEKATAYIFPSFYEGFGLPPLEAMARGCPVVSSDRTCLPEVLGEAAIYFNPENEEEMQLQIEKIISDENLRQELIRKGYEQVKKYSWGKCAKETVEVYEEVL